MVSLFTQETGLSHDDALRLFVAGEEVPVTVREFSILHKLLSYPRKTFTRVQLMNEFWEADSTSGTRTVDVYMAKLRQKFAHCEAFEIVTVHGLGYKAVLHGQAWARPAAGQESLLCSLIDSSMLC